MDLFTTIKIMGNVASAVDTRANIHYLRRSPSSPHYHWVRVWKWIRLSSYGLAKLFPKASMGVDEHGLFTEAGYSFPALDLRK